MLNVRYKKILLFFFLSFFLFAEEKEDDSPFSFSLFDKKYSIEKDESKIVNLLNEKFKNVIKYNSNIQEHDIKEGKSYLKGNASLEYLKTKIKADWIEFNWKNGDLNAKGENNNYVTINQGKNKYLLKNFYINLNNKKGKANDLYIQEGDHVIIANKINKEKDGTSILKKVMYISDPFFIEKKDINPDFYLKTDSLKYFHKQKSIITGPVFFYWYKVPLPIVFPFLYMKKKNKKYYGMKFPIFQIHNQKISIENIEFSFPISNYFNFTMLNSIYGKEKWKLETEMKYAFNVCNGLILLKNYQEFSNRNFDYQFKWKHNKDLKFSTDLKFTADINYLTRNNFLKKNEIFVSNINIKKKFDNHSLLNISSDLLQDVNKGETKLKIPEIRFSMRKNFFLEKENPFIHKFMFNYQTLIYNSIRNYSTILFSSSMPTTMNMKKKIEFQSGIHNSINLSTYVFFSPFFKISPKIHYNVFFSTCDFDSKCMSRTANISTDIISIPFYKEINKNSIFLRHEIEPMLSFNIQYSQNRKKFFSVKKINFILNNNFEFQTEKKIKIFKYLKVNTSWILDELFFKWKDFHFVGYINFTKPIKFKYEGKINFDEKKETYFDFLFSSNFIRNKIHFFNKENEKKGKNRFECFFFDKKNYAKYEIPLNFIIDLHSKFYKKTDTEKFFNTFLSVNGSVGITKYWKIDFRTDYDLLIKKITFFNVIFYRDLRSFKMNFNWSPIGKNRSWSFFIGIKDPIFSKILQYSEKRDKIEKNI
ncbi:putative LPS assembly protein LptD [Blattabacterium cuenoti]|uniref:putative LPS assembly protein LptD n=1 Tax=Blattabacterium cuenoti TaxID=1653831 RepID=UPI00163B7944|nr:putative LPS assembly protein LptD [Blattabacterium cuenoti]